MACCAFGSRRPRPKHTWWEAWGAGGHLEFSDGALASGHFLTSRQFSSTRPLSCPAPPGRSRWPGDSDEVPCRELRPGAGGLGPGWALSVLPWGGVWPAPPPTLHVFSASSTGTLVSGYSLWPKLPGGTLSIGESPVDEPVRSPGASEPCSVLGDAGHARSCGGHHRLCR